MLFTFTVALARWPTARFLGTLTVVLVLTFTNVVGVMELVVNSGAVEPTVEKRNVVPALGVIRTDIGCPPSSRVVV